MAHRLFVVIHARRHPTRDPPTSARFARGERPEGERPVDRCPDGQHGPIAAGGDTGAPGVDFHDGR
ncbi:hypothetical protein D9M69_696310 [compost metagenome]